MLRLKRRRAGHAPALGALFCALFLATGCGAGDADQGGRYTGNQVASGNGGGGAGGRTGGSGGGLTGIDNPDPNDVIQPGGTGGEPENNCAEVTITASRILPTVMLVVDGSTSMEDLYGPEAVNDAGMPDPMAPARPTRWASVREALVGPEGVVPSLQGLVRFGLAVFGTQPTCPIPNGVIAPELNNAGPITPAVPATPPGFTTPTGPALDMVVDMLPDPTLVLDGTPIGPQIILLATDGDPNSCEGGFLGIPPTDYVPSINAALKAQAKHLKMYVVSVGQDAAAAHLQEMANIGANVDRMTGGATVYYPDNTAALKETLETLIGAELSCDLALDGQGVKLGQECTGTVMFEGQPLECNGDNGFELKDPKTLTIKGTTCETYKSSIDSTVSAVFPCESIIPG
jgi:hypothetical protein